MVVALCGPRPAEIDVDPNGFYPKRFHGTETHVGLLELAETLAALEPFDRGTIEEAVRDLADKLGVKAGDLIHPCRVALTGQSRSAGIFEVMEITPELRRMVHRGAASHEMRRHTRNEGVLSLREEGILVALAGKTSLEEVLAATHSDDTPAKTGQQKEVA